MGARSAIDVLQLKEFETLGDVFITTEDGTLGERGYVTQHSCLDKKMNLIKYIHVTKAHDDGNCKICKNT